MGAMQFDSSRAHPRSAKEAAAETKIGKEALSRGMGAPDSFVQDTPRQGSIPSVILCSEISR